MAKKCLSCGREFGFFSTENQISPISENRLCTSCYSIFGIHVNQMKALNTVQEIHECYKNALRNIHNSSLNEKDTIQYEVEELYRSRLDGLELNKFEKEKEIEAFEKKKKEEQQRAAQQAEQKAYIEKNYSSISSNFIMTTGGILSGYEITDYLGIVSDGVVQGTGFISELSADWNDLFGTESNTFAKKMKMCRDAALQKAKDNAIQLGANALISIDFETSTFRNNMIGVMVSGTAVKIKKVDTDTP